MASGGRLLALEGLRGIAATVVVVRHVFNAVEMPVALRFDVLVGPLAPVLNAQGAVQVFFVLSGYVLARSVERSRSSADWPQFWIKRICRIHPPYLFGLLLAWTLGFLAVAPPEAGLSRWVLRFHSVHLELTQLLPYLAFPGTAGGQFPVGWTLTAEMIYSLALPIMFWLARPARGLILLGASVALLTLGAYAIDFALGILAYREREAIGRAVGRLPAALGLGIPLVGVALLCAPMWLGWANVVGDMVIGGAAPRDIGIMGPGALLLVVAAAGEGPFRRALEIRPVLFLGRISYSLYLVHFPILVLVAPLVVRSASPWNVPLLLAVVLSLSILVSITSYRYVERPSITLGNRLCRVWASRVGDRALESRAGGVS